MFNLYKLNKKTKNRHIYEIILQWYLIQQEYRSIAFISGYLLTKEKFKEVVDFMEKNNISFFKLPDEKFYKHSFVIYNLNKIDIKTLTNISPKKLGKLLGNFYTCATNKYNKYDNRIVIEFNNVEIYAQMCKKGTLINNFAKTYNIYLDLYKIFNQLDKNIYGSIQIYKVNN